MKKLLLSLLLSLFVTIGVFAQTNPRSETVHSYTKKDGTHVNSYHKTAPNRTQRDNYSAKGNTNPYTGKKGYKYPKK
jgi:hypothetical protein